MSLIRMPSATAAAGHCRRRRLLPALHYRLVVLATDKNDRGRSRFDGAHELSHLVMHGEHVWGLKQVESQAHAFAAAFLMPDRDIRDELPSYAAGRPCLTSSADGRSRSPRSSCERKTSAG